MKVAKREVAWATGAVNEQIDLLEEIRRDEGRIEANKSAMWHETKIRMQRAIETLKRAEAPFPERLAKDWAYYRFCGWHSDPKALP